MSNDVMTSSPFAAIFRLSFTYDSTVCEFCSVDLKARNGVPGDS